jgi:hypothetical protein|tara:strand:+ start:1235 stop:1495 length:261 start_codon:yes stop_codon:yes gene_type:complete
MIKTGEPFLVENNIKLRKTADIEGNVGKIIRVGTMNDEEFDYDIGTFISIDMDKGYLLIRSLKSNELIAYDINCTNSGLYEGTIKV